MDCNILNCLLRWQMSTYIYVKIEHFSLALTVFEKFTFQNAWPWKCRSRSWRTTFAVAPFDGRHPISYLMVIVMFALWNIRKSRKMSKLCPWKWPNSWSPIHLEMFESLKNFFRILATWQHAFMQKDTQTRRETGDYYRQNLQRRFA